MCKQLHLDPLNGPPSKSSISLYQPLLLRILKQEPVDLKIFASFVAWLDKNSNISLQELPELCTILQQIPGVKISGSTFKVEPTSTPITPLTFPTSISTSFTCHPCTTTLPTTLSVLLHLAEQPETTCKVSCSSCTITISHSKLTAGSLEEVRKAKAMLDIHQVTRQHIASMFGEVEDSEAGVCDPCGVTLATDKETTKHMGGKKHKQAAALVEEYVMFCSARSLKPTSHRNFPSFVFFLRF